MGPRVSPGQKLSGALSAALLNTVQELAARQRLERLGPQGAAPVPSPVVGALECLVRNDSDAAVEVGGVLAATGTPLDVGSDPLGFAGRPVLTGEAPLTADDAVLVLLERVAPGELGRAAAVGLAAALLDVSDAAHACAAAAPGRTDALVSAASGPATILWTALDGSTGPQWALVLLSAPTGAGAGPSYLAVTGVCGVFEDDGQPDLSSGAAGSVVAGAGAGALPAFQPLPSLLSSLGGITQSF